jgi:4-amino-4-deoxy-L-arabinose transferase-like glycosyltransferase
MNQPTPAIVTQDAARRLPRWALLLFCAAYVIPGFVGREPWKSADMTALGYIFELAQGRSDWLSPTLVGVPPEFDALLPYWLGAWAMKLGGGWLPLDFAARMPFVALLVLTLVATWYGVYSLARSPGAQPVPFAFGGEAQPIDYARAMADGGLLALVACLGLAQLSHETTPSLAQLAFTALTFHGLAAVPYRQGLSGVTLAAGLAGLALSGAPSLAMLFAAGGAAVTMFDPPADAEGQSHPKRWAAFIVAAALAVAVLAWLLDAWRWRIGIPQGPDGWQARAHLKLIVWFTWPAWPLAVWTIWRWRQRLVSRHVALPLWFAAVSLASAFATPTSDRSLLLGLPAFAALAAFALPTFERSVSALIDWFTLLFFSGCALVIWVVWVSLMTGVPAKPAANVAKLAPGFTPTFSLIAFIAAVLGTLAWAWLVQWRAGRHRAAIWKSLVLPAGGMALCWLLVMTLWLPALDYARSYVPVVRGVQAIMLTDGCVEAFGLNRGQLAALRFHGRMDLRAAQSTPQCRWLVVSQDYRPLVPLNLGEKNWESAGTVRRPTDANDNLHVFRRKGG